MPFVFQRKIGTNQEVISPATVVNMLRRRRCEELAGRHPGVRTKMLPRLDEIEDGLLGCRARAEHEAWLGEVEGIDLTLTFLRQKREETERLGRIAPVDLGIPRHHGTAMT